MLHFSAFLLGFCAVVLTALNVPFEVNNWPDIARTQEPVTAGIPLPQGAVTDITKLRITDGSGNTVPAQFKWLSKWWWEKNAGLTQDPSLKWVLCDFQATVASKNKAVYTIRDDNSSTPATTLSVTDATDKITVATGAITFTVSKQHFNLFDEVWLGATQIATTGNSSGGFITAGDWAAGGCVTGTVHKSSQNAPDSVFIQENGPMKVVIRVEGRHFAASGGVSRGLYGYQVFITAYAGKAYVDVQWAVTNFYLEGAGTAALTRYIWPFSQYDLKFAFHLAGSQNYAFYTDSVLGERTGSLSTGSNIRLLQKLGAFSLSSGGTGVKAKGMAAIYNGSSGVMFGMRDFAYNTPKAVRLTTDSLVLEAFPDTGAGDYFLDAAQRKTHRVRFEFFSGAYQPGMLLNFYKRMDAPLRALNSQDYYAASGAWYHRGFAKVPAADWQRMDPTQWRCFFSPEGRPPVQWIAEAQGADWRSFGCWEERFSQPGDHWNLNSVLYPYLCTGDPSVFELTERRTFWFNDMTRIHYGARRMAELYAAAESYCVSPRVYEPVETSENAFPGYTYNTHEDLSPVTSGHIIQQELIEFYLMTGDPMTYESILDMGVHSSGIPFSQVYMSSAWDWPWQGWPNNGPRVNLDSMNFGSDRYCARPGVVALHAYEVTGDSLPFLSAASLSAYSLRNWYRWTPTAANNFHGNSESDDYSYPWLYWKSKYPEEAAPAGTGNTDFQQATANDALWAYWQVTHDHEIYDALVQSSKGLDWRITKDSADRGFQYAEWSDFCMEGKRYNDCGVRGSLGHGEAYGGYALGYLLTGIPELWTVTATNAYKNPTHYGYDYIYGPYDPTDWRTFTIFSCAYKHDSLDATPPAAVADLGVTSLGGGQYRLNWTAPAGATRYRVKYARSPIVDFTTRWNPETEFGWPDMRRPLPYNITDYFNKAQQYYREQEISFWAIPGHAGNEPVPSAGGSAESFTVSGLTDTGGLYFALVSFDSAFNVSPISNVASTVPAVTAVRIKGTQTVESGASGRISAVLTYAGGALDSSGTGVYFRSLDPDVARAAWYGKITGMEETGTARIEIRRGLTAVDTFTVNVIASSAAISSIKAGSYNERYFYDNVHAATLPIWTPIDSMQMVAGDVYHLRVFKAAWQSDTLSFSRDLPDSAYVWTSSNTGVVSVNKYGSVTGVAAGHALVIVGLNGVNDTVPFTIWPRPSYIKRFDFEGDSFPNAHGWTPVWTPWNPDLPKCTYNAARGFGMIKDGGAFSFNTGSIVMKTFMGTFDAAFNNPWNYTTEDMDMSFKVDLPRGDYIVRTAMGTHSGENVRPLKTEWTRVGTDTIAWNPIVTGSPEQNVTVTDDTITVATDTGVLFDIHGLIPYMIIISKEGIDMAQVAYDTGELAPPSMPASAATTALEEALRIPVITELNLSNYPNPFNPAVTLSYSLPMNVSAELRIFDTRGRMVAEYGLKGGKFGKKGCVIWNGLDRRGKAVASGLYVGRLQTSSGKTLVRKMVLVR